MQPEMRRYIDMSRREFHDLIMKSTPEEQERIIERYKQEVEQDYRMQRAKNYDALFAGPPRAEVSDELIDEYYRLEKQKIWLDLVILWVLSVTGIAWLILYALSNL